MTLRQSGLLARPLYSNGRAKLQGIEDAA